MNATSSINIEVRARRLIKVGFRVWMFIYHGAFVTVPLTA